MASKDEDKLDVDESVTDNSDSADKENEMSSEPKETDKEEKADKKDEKSEKESDAAADSTEPAEKDKNKASEIQAKEEETPAVSTMEEGEDVVSGLMDVQMDTSSRISSKTVIAFVILLLLIGAGVGGVFFLRTQPDSVQDTTPTLIPTAVPAVTDSEASPSGDKQVTPEATEEADQQEAVLADYSVQVLNGSGVAGEAGRVQDLLAEEGFEDIDVGNADSYDYTDTEVRMGAKIPSEVFSAIEETLSGYTIVDSGELPDDSDYDVEIIVGTRETTEEE